jgi:diguanylate cyclase
MSLIDSLRLARMRRSLVAAGSLAGYVLFFWVARELGVVDPAPRAGSIAFTLVVAGILLLAAAIAVDLKATREPGVIDVLLAGWVSVALILTSFVITMPWRPLPLVATLFALTVSALHMRRRMVNRLALLMVAVYALALAFQLRSPGVDREIELIVAMVYLISLVGGVVVAGEVAALHTALTRRTRELEQVLEKLSTLAMRDDLTGLYNRRQLMELLQRQKAIADRGAQEFAICYVDLDHFKRVNDQFGHHRGDELLKTFSRIALRVVREEDFVARIGGEEFVLVLVNACVDEARAVAERLRRQTQLILVEPDAPDFMVTVSVGIAGYQHRENTTELLSRADNAMYDAKRQGRNRVVVAPVPMRPTSAQIFGD